MSKIKEYDKKKKELSSKYKDIISQFKHDICDKSDNIDPDSELEWKSLSIGYFLAKGIDIETSYTLSAIVRYDYQYWQK